MAAPSHAQDGDHGFQIAPMVDVVFVLLLFFMALAGARQIETRLAVDIPSGIPGEGDPAITVDISATGTISANGTMLVAADAREVAALDVWLKKTAAAGRETPFLIRPDANAQHERFIQVLGALQRAGFRKITFA